MGYKCHARGCNREVPPAKLMCFPCWVKVPNHLKRAVRLHYRPGQELTKNPSNEYLAAAQAAIHAVAELEDESLHNLR